MKREILFRGKSTIDGTWVYGFLNHAEQEDKYYIGVMELMTPVIPETVGQFTGLTDKDGVMIFEGDLRDFCGWVGYVIWDDVCFAIKSRRSEAVHHEHSKVFVNSTLFGIIHDKK